MRTRSGAPHGAAWGSAPVLLLAVVAATATPYPPSKILGGISWNEASKWFSGDGLKIWPEYSSVWPYDSLNLIEGTIPLAPASSVKGLSTSTGAPAVLDKVSLSDPGNLEYIDRTYRLTSIPAAYLGAEMIRLANNDKHVTANNYVSFTSTVPQRVCVGWDPQNPVPPWLSSWTKASDELVGNTRFEVYRRAVAAGAVHIPGPATRDNYLLLVGC